MAPGKRMHRRVQAALPCELVCGGESMRAQMVDLSLGGARFRPEGAPPALGVKVRLRVSLQGLALGLVGQVVRHPAEGEAAIAFEPLAPAAEAAVSGFISSQERALLRNHLHLKG